MSSERGKLLLRPFRSCVILGGLIGLFSSCGGAPKKSYTAEERARMWVSVASGALTENDPVGALQALEKAEAEDKGLAEIHHVRAQAYSMRRDPESALKEARKAVEIDPKYSEARNTLGKLLIDKGSYAEAIPILKIAAEDSLYRGSYKPLTNLGIVYYRQGKYDLARAAMTKAIDLSPVHTCVAHFYRGHINLRESRVREAIRDYDQATHRICADFADAHFALAVAYERDRQYDNARKKFLEIQQRYPNSPIADQAIAKLRDLP